MSNRTAQFAAVYAVLTASHEVADYWVQQDKDAVAKGRPGMEGGWRAPGTSPRTRRRRPSPSRLPTGASGSAWTGGERPPV
ncbi:hypothetical protein ACFQ0X_43905 [Streptomyces rectiviolaceus]|uniref:hypothetical protein n=1 Tax=Streptomyces rectiviolaceus TaxID=332591 RepID=UPI003637B800